MTDEAQTGCEHGYRRRHFLKFPFLRGQTEMQLQSLETKTGQAAFTKMSILWLGTL